MRDVTMRTDNPSLWQGQGVFAHSLVGSYCADNHCHPRSGGGTLPAMNASMSAVFCCTLACLGVALATASGCEDQRRHKPSEVVEYATVEPSVASDASPDLVAMALLDALQQFQAIRESGLGRQENRQKYDTAMGTINSLAAQELIHERISKQGSFSVPKDVTKQAALRLVTESWTSIVAHYADGLLFETLKVDSGSQDSRATVRVEVENPHERKRMAEIEALPEIADARGKDGKPLSHTSQEYLDLLRSRTLAEGFNVPIRRRVIISMVREKGVWRVFQLALEPAPRS